MMQVTAAPPLKDDVVDPAYAAALADTLRAVFNHMAAPATLRDSASESLTFELGLAPGVLLV